MDRLIQFLKENKKLLIIIFIVLVIAGAGCVAYVMYEESTIESLTYSQMQEMIERNEIKGIEYTNGKDIMSVSTHDGKQYKATFPEYDDFRKDMLKQGIEVRRKGVSEQTTLIIFEIVSTLVLLLFVRVAFSTIGNVEAKDVIQKSDIKFEQIIGLDEIMEDISLYVAMIKDSHIGDAIGAKLPKGVLLSGNPGTGKTLIAKAIAGEAGVPFISLAGSEFAELYKGVGAKRVRKIFKLARKNAPCVVFIDELDAIGGKRNSNKVDSEDTQTLNQLLKEMDGFKSRDGVFILAATNCPDNLDDALRRAGRFDREVHILPPRDWKVRKQLLEYYLKDRVVSDSVNIEKLAKSIAGFTGADIAMICNEAAIVAIAKNLPEITTECIDEAIDKKIFSGNRLKNEHYAADREIVAYHEAGHAVMKYLLGQSISRASIVGTTSGVGGAVFGEEKDSFLRTRKDIQDDVFVCYAGRAAEMIKFGDVTNGSSNDITKATEQLMMYISRYGFDDEVGAVDFDLLSEQGVQTQSIMDRVQTLSKDFEAKVQSLLVENYKLVEIVAQSLLDRGSLNGNDINALLESVELNG